MKLPLLRLETSRDQQLEKIHMEYSELYTAMVRHDELNTIEECLDVIQSTIGLLLKFNPINVIRGVLEHNRKLEGRGHDIFGHIKLKISLAKNRNV